ncbi:hypothetical protein DEU56DRAFT_754270 [Suillus clintonianus]|uniref:uncharacterized protein n=1 Tax=Suillus clintonianus TaxID=1904413 RepID=UPI001B86DAD3|nr:uncharacterized protein DEU56DRAFT_754270 [Suillus clintonianus]KAG2144626.1 hypothetical protein DEU56DRAFT_754270 [Suillus clintonianus]
MNNTNLLFDDMEEWIIGRGWMHSVIVRVTFPSTNKVNESGCQSIYRIERHFEKEYTRTKLGTPKECATEIRTKSHNISNVYKHKRLNKHRIASHVLAFFTTSDSGIVNENLIEHFSNEVQEHGLMPGLTFSNELISCDYLKYHLHPEVTVLQHADFAIWRCNLSVTNFDLTQPKHSTQYTHSQQ